MCGRYYIQDDTLTEMEELVRKLNHKLKAERNNVVAQEVHMGDIHPSEKAPVVVMKQKSAGITVKKWGFPGFGSQKLIFNARSETVLEKKTFRDSILQRRCVIPAACFYEWNTFKEKFTFQREDGKAMLLAGFYRKFGQEEQFVILTTAANAGMKDVHERMPLLIEREDMWNWLTQEEELDKLLKKKPVLLKRIAEYEQQRLW